MRSLLISIALGVGALGFLGSTPARADANVPGAAVQVQYAPYYNGYYAPAYGYPGYSYYVYPSYGYYSVPYYYGPRPYYWGGYRGYWGGYRWGHGWHGGYYRRW
jgi:hypothetical protein